MTDRGACDILFLLLFRIADGTRRLIDALADLFAVVFTTVGGTPVPEYRIRSQVERN